MRKWLIILLSCWFIGSGYGAETRHVVLTDGTNLYAPGKGWTGLWSTVYSCTNGLASTQYVDTADALLYPRNNPSNWVTADVTNGLASTQYVDTAGALLYPRNNPSNWVTADVTNGLASTNWVIAQAYGDLFEADADTLYGRLAQQNIWTLENSWPGTTVTQTMANLAVTNLDVIGTLNATASNSSALGGVAAAGYTTDAEFSAHAAQHETGGADIIDWLHDLTLSGILLSTNTVSTNYIAGCLGIGTTDPRKRSAATEQMVDIESASGGEMMVTIIDTAASASGGGGKLALGSHDGAVMGTGHRLGALSFAGSRTGSDKVFESAQIDALTDAAWGTGDFPSYLRFKTCADGSGTLTERMRINSAGNVGIGITPTVRLHVEGDVIITTNLTVNGTLNATATNALALGGVAAAGYPTNTAAGNATTNAMVAGAWVPITVGDSGALDVLGRIINTNWPASITNTAATSIGTTNATLNGQLLNQALDQMTVITYYGTNDGTNVAASWDASTNHGSLSESTFAATLYSLTEDTSYYYRSRASNRWEDVWATDSETFATLSSGTPGWTDPQEANIYFRLWYDPTATNAAGNVIDSGSGGNHCTNIGATWAISGTNLVDGENYGRTEHGFSFDGINDYQSIPSNLAEALTNSTWTFAYWIYSDGGGAFDKILVIDTTSFSFGVDLAADGIAWRSWYWRGGANYDVYNGPSLRTGQWIHFVWVHNSTITNQCYTNGVYVSGMKPSGNAVVGANVQNLIGVDQVPGTQWLQGKLDDLRLYKVSLTASEIANLYTNTAKGNASNENGY